MAYRVTTEKTWSRILDDIEETLRKWGGVLTWKAEPGLQVNRVTRQRQTAEERRVEFSWTRRGKSFSISMDKQDRAIDNLLVIWLILEALRLNEARGYAAQIAEVYAAEFPALPAPGQTSVAQEATTPYKVLYVRRDAPLAVCEAAYRALAKAAHPDAGGSDEEMARLTAAIEEIRKRGNP
ncbi:MAG TPA: hypothetical protein VFS21_03025 [Roseiflexaceae bacterium]|nr:hypothetical protein [Roseiflexaceae bacterium]